MKKVFYNVDNKKKRKGYIFWVLTTSILVIVTLFLSFCNMIVDSDELSIVVKSSLSISSIFLIKIGLILINDISLNAYVIDQANSDFFKVGLYPKNSAPTEEGFLLNTCYDYMNAKEKGKLIFRIKRLFISNEEKSKVGINAILCMIKLYNDKYVLSQLEKKNQLVIYKVLKVHSFFEHTDKYFIECDAMDVNTGNIIQNTKMSIDKSFEKNSDLKEQLKKLD